MFKFFLLIIIIFSISSYSLISASNTDAEKLGFIPNKSLCRGFVREKEIKGNKSKKVKIKSHNVDFVESDKTTIFGDVKITFNDYILHSNKANIYWDENKKRPYSIDLYENVSIRKQGVLVLTDNAVFNYENKSFAFEDLIFRLSIRPPTLKNGYLYWKNAPLIWGRSKKGSVDKENKYVLHGAMITSCVLDNNESWVVVGSKVQINTEDEVINIDNAVFKIKGLPVLYSPYLSYTYGKKRRTGLITPLVGYSATNGLSFGTPLYLNIKSNIDNTITPIWHSTSGIIIRNKFRYMTERSFSEIHTQNLIWNKKNNDFRYFFNIKHNYKISKEIDFKFDYNKVSDSSFISDFGSSTLNKNTVLLPREIRVDYKNNILQLTLMLQKLKSIKLSETTEQLLSRAVPYEKLPQISLNVFDRKILNYAWWNLNSSFSNFVYPVKNSNEISRVLKTELSTSIYKYIYFKDGVIKPQMKLFLNSSTTPASSFAFIPAFSLDYRFNINKVFDKFITTFQPRLFFLYIPYVEQSSNVNLTSVYLPLNYNQIFSLNRFSGQDRVANSKQVSLSIQANAFDLSTNTMLNIGIGKALYLEDRKVYAVDERLDKDLINYYPHNAKTSPLVGFIGVNVKDSFLFNWDFSIKNVNKIESSKLYFIYLAPKGVNFGISHYYSPGGKNLRVDQYTKDDNKLNSVNIFTSIPITKRWSMYASLGYNISDQSLSSRFFGVEHEGCCLGFRILAGTTIGANNHIDKFVKFEIVFKEFVSYSSSSLQNLLKENIPGFNDRFNTLGDKDAKSLY